MLILWANENDLSEADAAVFMSEQMREDQHNAEATEHAHRFAI